MSQNYYALFVNSVFELAETLVVKSEYSALRLNQYMLYTYGASSYEEQDPRTWKYYLNLAGEYHPRDQQMYVTSLDTLQSILFSKANLEIHTATRAAYQYNTRYYRELVTQYPEQEQLILGILYPADLDDAIAAPDFSVLAYPRHLVEHNEASLIPKIDEWVRNYAGRWNNRQFVHSDDLFGMAVLSELYGYLPMLIWNLRLQACHTLEAHSFHVREYLASHGMLDRYMNYLTHEQTMVFYRNINWIERNAGRQETFDYLLEKVMTLRGLPLSSYTMHHNPEQISTRLWSEVSFKKRLLNPTTRSQDKAVNRYSLDDVLDKEEPLAPGNREYRLFNQDRMRVLFENSLSNVVGTKVLESSVLDYTDAVPYTLHQILLNHWIYLSQQNMYNVYIQTKNPRTGELFSLHVRDAYLYFLYAWCKSMGITLTTIPKLLTQRIQRVPTPSMSDLMSVVDTKYVSLDLAGAVRNTQPELVAVSSVTQFQQLCLALHDSANMQNSLIALQEHMYTRGLLHGFVSRMYGDQLLPSPAPNKPYETWMTEQNFPFEGFTNEDWSDVYRDIYEKATGYKMDVTENLSGMQKAMIRLMEQLSSYSVQFVSEVNNTSIKVMNWAAVRLGDIRGSGKLFYEVILSMIRTINRNSYGLTRHVVDLQPLIRDMNIKPPVVHLPLLEIPVQPNNLQAIRQGFMPISTMQWDQSYDPENGTHTSFQQATAMSGYYAMTAEQKASVPNIYGECFKPVVIPTQIDIGDITLTDHLPGLVHMRARRNYLNAFQYFYVPQQSMHFMNMNTEVTLNAFYPNHGDLNVPMALNHGGVSVPSFEYVRQIPLEQILPVSETYSGGWLYAKQFDATLATDTETEILGINSYIDQQTFLVQPLYNQATVDFYKSVTHISLNNPIRSSLGSLSTPLTGVTDTRSLQTFGVTPTFTVEWANTFMASQLQPLVQHQDLQELGTKSSFDIADVGSLQQTYRRLSLVVIFNTTVAKSLTQPWRYATNHASLGSFSVIRTSRTIGTLRRSTLARSLPSFKLVMLTRSLTTMGLLVGHGPTTLSTVNSWGTYSAPLVSSHDVRTIVIT